MDTGRKLLNAVERIVDEPDAVVRRVERARLQAGTSPLDSEAARRDVAALLIRSHATRSAWAGGLSAAPALLPGAGTVVAAMGGALADVALTLKTEVELAQALTHLHGHDITDELERRRTYLLACVNTWEVDQGRPFVHDLVDVEATALDHYAPRQLTKVAMDVIARYAIARGPRLAARVVPVVGVVFSSTLNRALTTRVGWRCHDQLERRRRLQCDAAHDLILESRGKRDG